MKVLIVPEDPTLDSYVVKPVVERLCVEASLANAQVHVLRDPTLRGADQALDSAQLTAIVEENPMVDLFVLIVDRDCDRQNNSQRARDREAEHARKLLACVAIEEVEVWMLALHRRDLQAKWQDVRAHCDPKEKFAEPFLQAKGWSTQLGRGRKRAMRDLGKGWAGLLRVCEELGELQTKLQAWVHQR